MAHTHAKGATCLGWEQASGWMRTHCMTAGVKAHPISPSSKKTPAVHSQDSPSSVLSELPWLPSHPLHLQPAEGGSLAQGMPSAGREKMAQSSPSCPW